MDKEHILSEIRRLAEANGGRPLGRERFTAVTGIRELDWSGKYWLRWSEAVEEAGYEPNPFNLKFNDEQLLEPLAGLVRELGHFPTQAELRMKRGVDPTFPDPKTYRRFGRKAEQALALVRYCDASTGWSDVGEICTSLAAAPTPDEADESDAGMLPGFVYLMKSGRHYKIGRSNAVGRREYELAIQLPEAIELVHSIETDDAPGIELYWHQRFADRRLNGEWFSLTAADVKAFKRRRKFM